MGIWHDGTHGSYVDLSGARPTSSSWPGPPSDDELELAQENGGVFDIKAFALDGFVFLAHVDNPVESLTLEDIQPIYTGQVTSWMEVGVVGSEDFDSGAESNPHQRNPNSGSQELMETLVMKGIPFREPG